ncbi:MAG TPA: hypothetical protein VF119_00900 [Candidatus Limnocylindrales bacterium]
MLDRMISGAGAVADGADRSVGLLTSSSRGGPGAARRGGLVVAVVLLALAGLLLAAGIEAGDASTPRSLDPVDVAGSAADPGERTYATMDGSLLTTWVETFEDGNDNGIEDADEHGIAWYYWLVDPEARRGVTVRSTRPPGSILTFRGEGIVIDDPGYPADDDPWYVDEVAAAGLQVDPAIVIDATHAVGETVPLDLAAGAPGVGTAVAISGPRTGAYLPICTHDDDRNATCDEDEVDRVEIAVFDPASKRAIRVLLRDPPEFADASLTGVLRREERAVDDAKRADGFDFGALGIVVSDRYVLDEAVPPGGAPLAFVLAFGLTALAGIILVGLAGGYLIYRRSAMSLPVPSTTLGPGDRIPVRISGLVRTPAGLGHVREAPGDLIRFVLGRQVEATAIQPPDDEPRDDGPSADERSVDAPSTIEPNHDLPPVAAPPDAATPAFAPDAAIATTLIVERADVAEGVALGLGELQRLSSGRVMTFRAPRPALRVVAGTGPLLLSFDTEAERDRAAAELLDESGFGPDGKPTVSA